MKAAKKHAISEGDNGNAEISFEAGVNHVLTLLRSQTKIGQADGDPKAVIGSRVTGAQWADWLEKRLYDES